MKKHGFILLIICSIMLFSSCQSVCVTPAPPETTVDEWKEMIKGTYDYLDEHGDSSIYQYQTMSNAVKYKGTAQLWMSDHEGNGLELVFEKQNAVIKYLYGNDRFIYGYATFGDPNTYAELPAENEGRCVIDLETGEFISIPYLDVVLPEGYWLDDEVAEEEGEG